MARKRAAGGGRKPRGPFSELTSSFSVRMPNDLRKKLKRAAKKRPGRWSVGQELLERLHQSFAKENDEERDPTLRMFDALMDGMLGMVAPDRRYWEKDPWLYRASTARCITCSRASGRRGRSRGKKSYRRVGGSPLPLRKRTVLTKTCSPS